MTTTSRRNALTGLLGGITLGGIIRPANAQVTAAAPRAAGPLDWASVPASYRVTPDFVNLENGYWGVMAEPVRLEFERLNAMINSENTVYARSRFSRDLEDVRQAVARLLGATLEEVALTRGATEALKLLIGNYNKLVPGDAVLYADLDYDSMQTSMKWLKQRRGVDIVTIALPEPATKQGVIDAYDAALKANPKVKLLLLTHVSHRTGLLVPVPEIAAMAKARGVDVVVDAAHSIGQVDFKVGDLKADFVGFNLHKWIGAPIGVGCMYIRKERLADIDRDMGDEDFPETDIRSRVHTGTYNFATVLTVPKAIEVHESIGSSAKQARLTALQRRWTSKARTMKGVEVLVPEEPGMAAALGSFRLLGKTSAADNNAIVAALRDQHRILTVRRGGVAKGQCIRVTPALYTSEADIDRFVEALAIVSGNKSG